MSLYLIADKLKDLDLLSSVKTSSILSDAQDLQDWVSVVDGTVHALGSLLNKDIQLGIINETIEIPATELNAAPVGTFKWPIAVLLRDSGSDYHVWANFEFVHTIVKVSGDTNPPTLVQECPKFDHGRALVDLLFLTDGGDECVYSSGDSYIITFRISNDDTWFGVEVTPVVITFNIT